MLKLFLVEDEIIMREGIKKNIPWELEGIEFAGEASDGELAYPLILKTKPDILVTDIKMPFMDGLELSRLVKQELPDIKIMILSGYDEFEYAKEAINIGITEYLLKPINSEKLLEAVKKVAKTIEKEKEQKDFLTTFESERAENKRISRNKFFRKLVSGNQSVAATLKEGRENGMELSANRFNIVLFQIFTDKDADLYSEEQSAAGKKIEEITEKVPQVYPVEMGLSGWAFILTEREGALLEEILLKLENILMDIVKECGNGKMEYFGGIGEPIVRLSEFDRCFDEASRAFSYRYLKNRNQFLEFSKIHELPENEDALEVGALQLDKLDRKISEGFLSTGTTEEIPQFIDDYFESLGRKNMESMLFRQYVVMDMYFAAVARLEKMGYSADDLVKECGDFKKMSVVFQSLEQSRSYMIRVFETVINLRDKVSRKKYAGLLDKAKKYIEGNYDREDISLNVTAAAVNLSPNHFSTIFSQETGKTFIEFLTQVRMEKAKELLRTTNKKSSEIAYEVGYKDSHYFSYLFKKTQECTPREYRGKA